MAFAIINFKHPDLNITKKAPAGFSWTTFFFGVLPALLRKDIKWFVIQLIAALITMGFSTIIFMFIYNKLYIKQLINEGYEAVSVTNSSLKTVQQKLEMVIPKYEYQSSAKVTNNDNLPPSKFTVAQA